MLAQLSRVVSGRKCKAKTGGNYDWMRGGRDLEHLRLLVQPRLGQAGSAAQGHGGDRCEDDHSDFDELEEKGQAADRG